VVLRRPGWRTSRPIPAVRSAVRAVPAAGVPGGKRIRWAAAVCRRARPDRRRRSRGVAGASAARHGASRSPAIQSQIRRRSAHSSAARRRARPPGRLVAARRGVQQHPDRVALSVVQRPLHCAAHRLGRCPRGPSRIRLETIAADRCRIRPDPLDHWSSLSTQHHAAGSCHCGGCRTSGPGRRDPAAAWQRRRRDRRRVRHRGGPGPAIAACSPDRFPGPDTCPYPRLSPRRPCLGRARPGQYRQPAGHARGFCRSRLASRRNRVQRRGV
jgi:hypothetical protein